MTRFSYALVWCALLIAAAGCGFTSSPAEHLTFKPPAGWQASPGVMGFMQFWKPPGNRDEALVLVRSPRPIQVSQVFNSANLKDTKVVSVQHITICGNQPAEFLKAQGTSQALAQKSKDVTAEIVVSNAGGASYMAMYVYPMNATPNSDADAALRELCQK